MSAPQTARERFEAWWDDPLNAESSQKRNAWAAWQAAERSAIERAAKVADDRASRERAEAQRYKADGISDGSIESCLEAALTAMEIKQAIRSLKP